MTHLCLLVVLSVLLGELTAFGIDGFATHPDDCYTVLHVSAFPLSGRMYYNFCIILQILDVMIEKLLKNMEFLKYFLGALKMLKSHNTLKM